MSRTELESGKVQDADDLPESDFMKAFKVRPPCVHKAYSPGKRCTASSAR